MQTLHNNFIIPNWPAPSLIKAYSSTRKNGCSLPPYDSLNLGYHVGDDPDRVEQNVKLMTNQLQLPEIPLWMNQVHGTEVIQLPQEIGDKMGDACFTQQPKTVCAVRTADCLPILLCHIEGSEVASIHAGWRGLLAGVIDTTLKKMHSPANQLLAWLGPAISQPFFEINEEIRISFIQRDPQNKACFAYQEDHVFADLYQIAKQNLRRCGVTQIYGGDFCTYQQNELFYSYRRDGKATGRMVSLIWIDQDIS